jgi:ABC-type transport system substrate-binding protein
MVDAFNYAWNETNYIQNDLSGLGVANPSIMLQGQLGYTTFSSYYPYNLTLAKQDIVKACLSLGCSASNPLQITLVGYNDQDAEAAGALLASNINSLQAGVNVVFEPSPTPTSVFLSKTWGIFIGELGSSPADPLAIPLQTLGTPSGLWGAFSDFTNSTVISMINQAATMVNQSQRELLYQQIDQAMAQTGHYIKVAQFEEVYVTSSRIAMTSFNEWTSVQGYPSIFALVAA